MHNAQPTVIAASNPCAPMALTRLVIVEMDYVTDGHSCYVYLLHYTLSDVGRVGAMMSIKCAATTA